VTYVLEVNTLNFPHHLMNQTHNKRRTLNGQRRGRRRRGSAAVECAFCIPVVLLIMFGTLETCSGVFLKEALTVTAYEGCRVGVRRRATATDVTNECNALLAARGITGATVTVTPNNFSALNALDQISVTVSAPTNGNSAYIFNFLADRSVSAKVTMVREFDE